MSRQRFKDDAVNASIIKDLRYMKKSVLFWWFILLISCSPPRVLHIDRNTIPTKGSGAYYLLPETEFTVQIMVQKTERIKGPYADFANKYLGLNNVITDNSTSYKLVNVQVTYTDMPDKEQGYYIENPGNMSKMINKFSTAGYLFPLLSFKKQPFADTLNHSTFLQNNMTESEYPEIFKYYADANLFMKVDTIIEKIKQDTQVIEKKTLKASLIEKPLEQKAKETADYIIRIKENKFNLIAGTSEVNYPKETLEYMFTQLENTENEYMKLFTGITVGKTLTYLFRISPERNDTVKNYEICHFSEHRGISRQNPGDETGIFLHVENKSASAILEPFISKADVISKDKAALVLRIPGQAEISIVDGNIELFRQTFRVWQLGTLLKLPIQNHKSVIFHSYRHNNKSRCY